MVLFGMQLMYIIDNDKIELGWILNSEHLEFGSGLLDMTKVTQIHS